MRFGREFPAAIDALFNRSPETYVHHGDEEVMNPHYMRSTQAHRDRTGQSAVDSVANRRAQEGMFVFGTASFPPGGARAVSAAQSHRGRILESRRRTHTPRGARWRSVSPNDRMPSYSAAMDPHLRRRPPKSPLQNVRSPRSFDVSPAWPAPSGYPMQPPMYAGEAYAPAPPAPPVLDDQRASQYSSYAATVPAPPPLQQSVAPPPPPLHCATVRSQHHLVSADHIIGSYPSVSQAGFSNIYAPTAPYY